MEITKQDLAIYRGYTIARKRITKEQESFLNKELASLNAIYTEEALSKIAYIERHNEENMQLGLSGAIIFGVAMVGLFFAIIQIAISSIPIIPRVITCLCLSVFVFGCSWLAYGGLKIFLECLQIKSIRKTGGTSNEEH